MTVGTGIMLLPQSLVPITVVAQGGRGEYPNAGGVGGVRILL
jgi:hypothetical protein